MFNLIFYILSAVIISSAFITAFSGRIINSVTSFIVLMASVFGLFVLLNSELFALMGLLVLSVLLILVLIFSNTKYVQDLIVNDHSDYPKGMQFASIMVLSVLGGVSASLSSSTRWHVTWVNYSVNSFFLLFTDYLPMVLMIVFVFSVLLTSLRYILRKDMQAG